MKTLLKVAGGIIGGYAVVNTLVLAWIGAGRLIKGVYADPDKSSLEIMGDAYDDAAEAWGNLIEDAKDCF